MMRLFLAVLFFAGLVGLYIFLFLKNKHTPKPAGCENLRPDCAGCHDIYCPNHAKES